jgi:hypothetical protein
VDSRPVLSINDVTLPEGSGSVSAFNFVVTLAPSTDEVVTVQFGTANGSALAAADYAGQSGTLTFQPDVATRGISILVFGDMLSEPDEVFLVNLSGASPNARIGDGQGQGRILNDDTGTGELSPVDSMTDADRRVTVTLTWTHPVRWRDLRTLDLRLRHEAQVIAWLRFDEAANTFALVDLETGVPEAGFPPGSPNELVSDLVTVVLAESSVEAAGPDAPSVDVTVTFRFAPGTAGQVYEVGTGATDDEGNSQESGTVGSIQVFGTGSDGGGCHIGATGGAAWLLLIPAASMLAWWRARQRRPPR